MFGWRSRLRKLAQEGDMEEWSEEGTTQVERCLFEEHQSLMQGASTNGVGLDKTGGRAILPLRYCRGRLFMRG